MKEIFIEGTKDTPTVAMKSTGEIKLQGRSFPENPPIFFTPLIEWINGYTSEKLIVEIRLDYFNTSTSKQLFKLLESCTKNPNIKDLNVSWYYEEGDEDTLEMGQHYSDMLSLPFKFIEYAESLN
jgi:hypothetical protein